MTDHRVLSSASPPTDTRKISHKDSITEDTGTGSVTAAQFSVPTAKYHVPEIDAEQHPLRYCLQ